MVKKLIFILMSSILLGVLFFSNMSAAITQEYCCERTSDGAVCQSSTECAAGSAKQSTSCDQTTFCKLGTCVDQTEGRCLPNTPQGVCNDAGGFWSEKAPEYLPQCNLGCCFYGGQSVFTTQTRCNTLAGFYGLEATYNSAITDEFTCYASANTEVEGACVFEKNGQTTCRRLTQGACNELMRSSANGEVKFNEGYLCSADFLGGICGASQKTTCVPGASEVYFLDTCGNIANIYDSSQWPLDRATNPEYWNKIIDKQDSCGYDSLNGNANSPSCGNCEYLLGSICSKSVNGETGNPIVGNNICKDLSCEYKGKTYAHGEKWCATGEVINAATKRNTTIENSRRTLSSFIMNSKTAIQSENVWADFLPGTESYVMKCYNGQVLEESCSQGEFRNKICIENEVEGINNAGCVLNVWLGCIEQETEEDCLNSDIDCEWIEGYSILKNEDDGSSLALDENGNPMDASCVPKNSPAFDFWNVENPMVDQICSYVQDVCKVEYEFPLVSFTHDVNRKNMDGDNIQDKNERAIYCSANCQCLEGYEEGMSTIRKRERFEDDHQNEPWLLNYKDWKEARDNVCFSVGDCGYTNNAFGLTGYYDEEDLIQAEFFRKAKDFREEYE